MKGRINQMEFVTGILKLLDRHGIKSLYGHQLNAVIAGATTMLKEIERPVIPARPGMGLTAWLKSDDTGASSLYMARRLAAGPSADPAYPHDPDDFGRCHRFLEAVPGTRANLPALAPTGPVWAALVEAWGELTLLYVEEAPTGKAPRLYARLQEIILTAKAQAAAGGGSL
jgi:hypothetical protein